MLNREKFLKQLGISPNWNSGASCQHIYSNEQEKGNWPIIYFTGRNPIEKDKQLVLYSPTMLCDMVEMIIDNSCEKGAICDNCNCEEDFYCTSKKSILTIESATGRKWQEVQKIARECVG